MIIGIVLVISISIASLSCFQLTMAMKVYGDTRARMAAESELNRGLMSLVKQTAFPILVQWQE